MHTTKTVLNFFDPFGIGATIYPRTSRDLVSPVCGIYLSVSNLCQASSSVVQLSGSTLSSPWELLCNVYCGDVWCTLVQCGLLGCSSIQVGVSWCSVVWCTIVQWCSEVWCNAINVLLHDSPSPPLSLYSPPNFVSITQGLICPLKKTCPYFPIVFI